MKRSKTPKLPTCEPCGKVSHASLKDAEVHARAKNNRPYVCPNGNGYHLSSHENTDKRNHQTTKFQGRDNRRVAPQTVDMTIEEMEKWAKEARGL